MPEQKERLNNDLVSANEFRNMLAQSKAYVLGVVGTQKVSQIIQNLSPSEILPQERLSHVALVGYVREDYPEVIESHFKTRGVRRIELGDWYAENYKAKQIIAFPYDEGLIREYDVYERFKIGYGTLDVLSRSMESTVLSWSNIVFPDQPHRVHCAEGIAENDDRTICTFKGQKRDDLIRPNDFKEFALKDGRPIYDLTHLAKEYKCSKITF